MTHTRDLDEAQRSGGKALTFALLAAPVAWFIDLSVGYAMVEWICQTGRAWPMHVAKVASIALASAGGIVAWRLHNRADREGQKDSAIEAGPRALLAWSAVVLSVFFLVIIIAAAFPAFVLHPCR